MAHDGSTPWKPALMGQPHGRRPMTPCAPVLHTYPMRHPMDARMFALTPWTATDDPMRPRPASHPLLGSSGASH